MFGAFALFIVSLSAAYLSWLKRGGYSCTVRSPFNNLRFCTNSFTNTQAARSARRLSCTAVFVRIDVTKRRQRNRLIARRKRRFDEKKTLHKLINIKRSIR